ncbi:M50 family metallopeptidase [Candidatus Uhrbacteria bacterium]|nr:M50 family metallopeptidase [Candidatus Uhrbacteria bacterium]
MRVTTLSGVPIRIHYSFLPLIFLFPITTSSILVQNGLGDSYLLSVAIGLIYLFAIIGSLLVHEFAHVLCARLFGIQTMSVTINVAGAFTKFRSLAQTPKEKAFIAVSGPLASLLLGLSLLMVAFPPVPYLSFLPLPGRDDFAALGIVASILCTLGGLNIIWGIGNLLPIFPLDGGHILFAYIWHRLGNEVSAQRAAARASCFMILLLFLPFAFIRRDPCMGTFGFFLLLLNLVLAFAPTHAEPS